jgi:hypothetical protein
LVSLKIAAQNFDNNIMVLPKYIYQELAPVFLLLVSLKIAAQNLDNNIMVSPKYIYQELAPVFLFFIIGLLG